MGTLNFELYQALKEANVSEETAKAAATAVASVAECPVRLSRVESDITVMKGDIQFLKSDMVLLKWMVGFNLAMTVGVFWKMMKV
jgi:hypothetical protein